MFDKARAVLRQERLIAKSERRTRRPTREELSKLSRYFYGHWMLHIMWFAIYSTRREGEIVRLRWDDLNAERHTCLLRGLKNPRERGQNAWFKLPKSAFKIVMRQERRGEFIFPYHQKTISKYFRAACNNLGIDGLRFHDLRHEAISRLRENGLSGHQIMQISLHRSMATMEIYMNLDPGDLDV
jgi:integrase